MDSDLKWFKPLAHSWPCGHSLGVLDMRTDKTAQTFSCLHFEPALI